MTNEQREYISGLDIQDLERQSDETLAQVMVLHSLPLSEDKPDCEAKCLLARSILQRRGANQIIQVASQLIDVNRGLSKTTTELTESHHGLTKATGSLKIAAWWLAAVTFVLGIAELWPKIPELVGHINQHMVASSSWWYVVDKLWPALLTIPLAVYVAQLLIEKRKPQLEMIPEENVYSGTWFDDTSILHPYHSWRIRVQHIRIPWYLTYFIKARESAHNCRAVLAILDSEGKEKFRMHGRWANSPEPTRVHNTIEKIIYPDPIDIGYHDDEPTLLDCAHKFDSSTDTYTWNNESYLYNGMTPNRKLDIGTYTVITKLSSPNVRPFTTEFTLVISDNWQETSLTLKRTPN